jgi:hypothetical protein
MSSFVFVANFCCSLCFVAGVYTVYQKLNQGKGGVFTAKNNGAKLPFL